MSSSGNFRTFASASAWRGGALALSIALTCFNAHASPIALPDLDAVFDGRNSDQQNVAAAATTAKNAQAATDFSGQRLPLTPTTAAPIPKPAVIAPLDLQPRATANVLDEAPSNTARRGPTLQEVLSAIVTVHRSTGQPVPNGRVVRAASIAPSRTTNGGGDEFDLRKLLLDSEIAGSVLRASIDIKSADSHGATFAIFGMGNFAVDVAPDLRTAIVSDLSSGLAFRMSLGSDRFGSNFLPGSALNSNTPVESAPETPNLVRAALRWLMEFLNSPIGVLLWMSMSITLVLWICVRSVAFLQQRASRYERR